MFGIFSRADWQRVMPGLAGLLAALAAGPARAQAPGDLYQWTDAGGVVRYTAHLERIPESALASTLVIRRAGPDGAVLSFRWGEAPGAESAPVVAASSSGSPGNAGMPAPPEPPTLTEGAEDSAPAAEAPSFDEWIGSLDRLHPLEGGRLYRTRVALDGRGWERLRLGVFPSLAEARAALARLAPHFPGAWIDRAGSADRAAVTAAGGLPRTTGGWVVQLAARPLESAEAAEAPGQALGLLALRPAGSSRARAR